MFQLFKGVLGYSTPGNTCLHVSQGWAEITALGSSQSNMCFVGQNTVVPHDPITWSPEFLTNAEALAQKEDLILWPPLIVVHNISMSDSNPRKWKVVKVEEVETFLRGK